MDRLPPYPPPLWRLLPLLFASLSPASAHQQPVTLAALTLHRASVTLDLHLPLNELELAFGHAVTENPKATLARWRAPLAAYLAAHIRPESEGRPWAVSIGPMHLERAEQTQSGPFEEVLVRAKLTPPDGVSPRRFSLAYDAILHQVVTHRVLVSIARDWEAGQVEARPLATIAVDTASGRISPLAIDLEAGRWGAGFAAMVALGRRHIAEGTDHLLFLIALLLPAGLAVDRRRWAAPLGAAVTLRRVAVTVTAFTLGHSLTLAAGALDWLRLPSAPVEVLIAFSILLTAIHAAVPLFPGREAYIAAAFGLIHGLAFASALAELQLDGASLALGLLGFNLGIELTQLFAVALVMPWFLLVAQTPWHAVARLGGATFCAVAALGWIASRLTGQTNTVERALDTAAPYAPLGVLALALVALPAYLLTETKRSQSEMIHER